ncbi:hypothetical protein JL722_12502 [Aureococcus anophagefferens]|nr:hypothetical protein JL722_12502 [Aureococcus anophagefferens]
MADADAIAAMLAGIKIYYINLDRATLRREAMEAQLARCDDVVRVAAVDGAADAAAPAARLQAWGLEDDDRSPAELACVLSHVEAAAQRDGGGDLSLVLEDDACLAHVAVPSRTSPRARRAGPCCSSRATTRTRSVSLAAGAPFAPWRRDHWGAGAYLLSRAGAAACADPSTFSPRLGKLVADEAVFWRAGAYSYTRPCVGDLAVDGSAIQPADHTELVHGPSRALNRAYFSGAWHDRRVLGALFDGRARSSPPSPATRTGRRRRTWPDVELLVYDDGPAPSPLLRARDCSRPRRRDPRLSLGEKRNRLLALATGEYVANFDDDNVYAPTYLEAMVRRLDASGAGLVSLDEAWVATLAGAAANGADACRRLGGFHARGETFLHRNVALAAAAYAPLNVGEELGELRRALAAADAPPPVPPDAAATPERGA